MTDEKQLIRRMLGGEERAFEAFFDAYFARVYRFALPRLNGDVEAAREVVQATLAKAMRRIGDFRGDSALFTWICQICRREAVDHIRARRRQLRHVVLIDDRPDLRSAIDALEAPEEYDLVKQHGRAEVGRLVRVVLDRLPANYGDALEWMMKLADGSIDAIITDPPYCSGAVSEASRSASKGQGRRSENLTRFGWFVGDNMTTAGLTWLLRLMACEARRVLKPSDVRGARLHDLCAVALHVAKALFDAKRPEAQRVCAEPPERVDGPHRAGSHGDGDVQCHDRPATPSGPEELEHLGPADQLEVARGDCLYFLAHPACAAALDDLHDLLERSEHLAVLELTEHDPVDDYGALRSAVSRLGDNVRLRFTRPVWRKSLRSSSRCGTVTPGTAVSGAFPCCAPLSLRTRLLTPSRAHLFRDTFWRP